MIIQIDFEQKVVFTTGVTLKDVTKIGKMIDVFGYNSEEFNFQAVVEFVSDVTEEIDVKFVDKDDIN